MKADIVFKSSNLFYRSFRTQPSNSFGAVEAHKIHSLQCSTTNNKLVRLLVSNIYNRFVQYYMCNVSCPNGWGSFCPLSVRGKLLRCFACLFVQVLKFERLPC
jgi:hypothetical protein